MASERAFAKMRRAPKYKVQHRNRCGVCGRPRGYIRHFNMCRVCFRERAHRGELPGVKKSSW
jgi:small subunit ribosomal protein S14